MFEDRFFDDLKKMQKSLNKFFSDFDEGDLDLREESYGDYRRAFSEFDETDNEFIINIELPGMNKEDIELNMEKDYLEVRAKKKQEKSNEKEGKEFYARSFSGFYQRINLPENSDAENVDAKYENGVLILRIPKKHESKDDKKFIQIK